MYRYPLRAAVFALELDLAATSDRYTVSAKLIQRPRSTCCVVLDPAVSGICNACYLGSLGVWVALPSI